MSYINTGDSVFSAKLNMWVDVASLAHVYTYNGDNTIASDACTDGSKTWTKTYGYTSGNLTTETAWVQQ